MLYETPSINDLLDIYEDNPEWNELQDIFNEVIDIVYNCLNELSPFLIQDNKRFLPDDEHYLLLYLFRTKRIFESILLLLIYERYAEAKMLQRALLENIVDTKMFLKEGRREKNKRNINLHHLFNEQRRYELYIKDYRRSQKEHGFILTTVAIQKMNERLEQAISEGFKNYSENEIANKKDNFNNGLSWHGCSTKEAFKRCGMEDEYQDYNIACAFVHIRDLPFPAGLLPVNDRETTLQLEFNTTLSRVASHIQDIIQFCPNTLANGADDKIQEMKERIFNLTKKLSIQLDPEIFQFIGISDWVYE